MRAILHLIHEGTICKALISCESNPDVISIPMAAGTSNRYRFLKCGLRTHDTVSSSTRRVRTGSPAWPLALLLPWFRIPILVSIFGDGEETKVLRPKDTIWGTCYTLYAPTSTFLATHKVCLRSNHAGYIRVIWRTARKHFAKVHGRHYYIAC